MNFESYYPYMFALLKKLVETESPSHNKSSVDTVGKIILEELKSMGASIEIVHNETRGNHIIATFFTNLTKLKNEKEYGFLILCHMDTVYPIGTINTMPFQELDDKLLGPGVADMKSGSVIALAVIKSMIDNNQQSSFPVTFLFTSDEEIGSGSSKEWIEKLAINSELVLVMEPGMPDGSIKTWRKGVGGFHIEVHGQAAHAGGNHEKGRNAIEELAHQVITIQKLTNYKQGTTLNVGVIQGGIGENVVPDHAWMDVDLRVMKPGEAERIIQEVNQLAPVLQGTTIQISGGLNRPPMPYDNLMQTTFAKAKKIAEKIGIKLHASGTGGASDGNFVAPLGIPVLDGLGAIGGDYHSKSEYIIKESLVSRAEFLSAILQNW
jgi:glutamate carboxypeptidase